MYTSVSLSLHKWNLSQEKENKNLSSISDFFFKPENFCEPLPCSHDQHPSGIGFVCVCDKDMHKFLN